MGRAEKKGKKYFVPISVPTRPGLRIPKEIVYKFKKKKIILTLFEAKPVGMGREGGKTNSVPILVLARPVLDYSEKNRMKIRKIKKHHSSFISSQLGPGRAKKVEKKISL